MDEFEGGVTYGVLGELELPLGLGLLRLSTEGRPSEADALVLIHQALDSGIRLLDTADTYSLDDKDLHYGERLARKAVETWHGPRGEVRILTKAGLSRPKGRWVPSGGRKSLRKAVEGSLKALGVDQLFMLLHHASDPRTPFEETLAALAELRAEGKILHLGLCNTSIPEVRQAERHFPVTAIQNELSVIDRKGATEGVVELARQMRIPFLAHRPMGGHAKAATLKGNRAVAPLVARYGITPHEAALAVALDQGEHVIPLIGPTKPENLRSCLRAISINLDPTDREAVGAKINLQPSREAIAATAKVRIPGTLRQLQPGEGPGTEPEVVLISGIQGAGKSELVTQYEAAGYARLNRDLLGGSLDDLVPKLSELLASGQKRVVLDNTYPTRVSRWATLRAAHSHGVPVRCIHLDTPLREATINVVLRVLKRYGKLLGPDEMKELAKTDPNLPPPAAMSRYVGCFEAPALDEGFGAVETVPFVRRQGEPRTAKGLLLDVDGTLRVTKSGENYPRTPDDIELAPGRREVLQRWVEDGYQLFLVSNQSGVSSGKLAAADADACFLRTVELLGLPVAEVAYCPHTAFPAGCFCRKPMPGMGVMLMERHGLAPEHLVMVGDMESDREFAKAIGARYFTADDFFRTGAPDGA